MPLKNTHSLVSVSFSCTHTPGILGATMKRKAGEEGENHTRPRNRCVSVWEPSHRNVDGEDSRYSTFVARNKYINNGYGSVFICRSDLHFIDSIRRQYRNECDVCWTQNKTKSDALAENLETWNVQQNLSSSFCFILLMRATLSNSLT